MRISSHIHISAALVENAHSRGYGHHPSTSTRTVTLPDFEIRIQDDTLVIQDLGPKYSEIRFLTFLWWSTGILRNIQIYTWDHWNLRILQVNVKYPWWLPYKLRSSKKVHTILMIWTIMMESKNINSYSYLCRHPWRIRTAEGISNAHPLRPEPWLHPTSK